MEKFYTNTEFEELIKDLLSIESYRVPDFLISHLNRSLEGEQGWLEALRQRLIALGFKQPEILNASNSIRYRVSSETPQQVNEAFMFILNHQIQTLKEKSALGVKPVQDWSAEDYNKYSNQLIFLKNQIDQGYLQQDTIKIFQLQINELTLLTERHENNSLEIPDTFDKIFEYPELIQDCIDVLKKVEPPIITNTNAFNLGSRNKGSIVAWVIALKKKGVINSNLSDRTLAFLLNSKFEGLNLGKDGRSLRNIGTSSYKKYYTDILRLLPDLPLST